MSAPHDRGNPAATPPATAPSGTARATSAAATRLLHLLRAEQRDRALPPFPGKPERSRWYYVPTDHGGLPLGECTPEQRAAVLRLLATGLSPAGYHQAVAIIGHELVLERLEDWPTLPGYGRVRDPERYAVTIFGDPASGTWGWRFGGHHLSLHHTVVGGHAVSATPSFFGVDPAEAPLPGGATLRPCGPLEDLGRRLVRSLDGGQLATAMLAPHAPPDIVTGNRPQLLDRAWITSPARWFRDPDGVPRHLLEALEQQLTLAESRLGAAAVDRLTWTPMQTGVGWPQLRADQQPLLMNLLEACLGRLPDDVAESELDRLHSCGLDRLHFAWAGPLEPGQPHYYRIHGPRLLVEYDNTSRDANHIHTVWRDPVGDFGRDVLAAHYAGSPHSIEGEQ